MNLYFAPLEGITTSVFRSVHNKLFGFCDYYAPFITPTENEKITLKTLKEVLPENNKDFNLTVQTLSNNPEVFLNFADKIEKIGYNEINLNFGCPSGTVVKKWRGAGALLDLNALDKFLYEIFERAKIKISVKTRVGFFKEEEFYEILKIYNKYPISLLTVHPRTREDYYKGEVRYEFFKDVYPLIKNKVCYNGDINSKKDLEKIKTDNPALNDFMIGRGAVKNPAIFREINGGAKLTTKELVLFTEELVNAYKEKGLFDTFIMHKIKEIWLLMIENYPEETKVNKQIKKAKTSLDILNAIYKLPEIKKEP